MAAQKSNREHVVLAVSVLALLSTAACSRKQPSVQPTTVPATAPQAATGTPQTGDRREGGEPLVIDGAHGTNKKVVHPVSVTVDGQLVAVLRRGELPPGLEPRANTFEGNPEHRFYDLSEYLSKVGVKIGAVKAVHLAGPRTMIASLEGSELRSPANKGRFVFHFGHVAMAVPHFAWSTTGLKNTNRIDMITNVAVYSKTEPPALRGGCLVQADGECATPFDVKVSTAAAKGTRVYVDGTFAGSVKRKLVMGNPDTDKGEYSLKDLLAKLGAEAKDIRGIEFLAGDDVIGRTATLSEQHDFKFELQKHSHGRIAVVLSRDAMSGANEDKRVPVTAIQVFKKQSLTNRPLSEITDDLVEAASRLGKEQDDFLGNGSIDNDEI